MRNNGLFTSSTDEWATPVNFFKELDHTCNFQLDVCASESNFKCDHYYTKKENGLISRWFGRVWCNPPYGKQIPLWIDKALSSYKECEFVYLLIPSRTDTIWFHKLLNCKDCEIKFIKGRLKFNDGKNSAPFPSCLAILKGDNYDR